MPVVIATIVPKEGRYADVVDAITDTIPAVHAEDGCERYALHQGEDRLVMVEKWSTQQALDVHLAGDNLKALGGRLRELVDSPPEVQLLEAVPAGEADKGTL